MQYLLSRSDYVLVYKKDDCPELLGKEEIPLTRTTVEARIAEILVATNCPIQISEPLIHIIMSSCKFFTYGELNVDKQANGDEFFAKEVMKVEVDPNMVNDNA